MRIAIPMAQGSLCMHFGHCSTFAIIDVENGEITRSIEETPPPHQPGLLPPWLADRGVDLVIAGGMGSRARNIFVSHGIQVITGAPGGGAEETIKAYLDGTLETGENACDH